MRKNLKKYAAIMAGGSGTRFWPKSSQKLPKQFLNLTGKRSLLQLTADRLKGLVGSKDTMIITTRNLAKLTKKSLPSATILAEPQGRNTMAAVCWAAWEVSQKGSDSLVAVLPADAHIADSNAYRETLQIAYEVAEKENRIVCLGIKPRYPATGYGYIEAGDALSSAGHTIKRFIEKPDLKTAEDFYASREFLWNAGIFVFKASVFTDEVRTHAPEFSRAFDALFEKKPKNFSNQLKKVYLKLPAVPVDVALMEKTTRGALIAGDFGWNDLGSWTALEEVLPPSSEAGLLQTRGPSISLGCSGLIVNTSSEKFVGLIGLHNLIVVETPEAILICEKSKAQEIKNLVAEIQKDKRLKKQIL